MILGRRVAQNAKAIRLSKGLSQQKLADKIGLTVRYLSRLENTAPNVTLEVLEKLAKGLDCTVNEIIGADDSKEAPKKDEKAIEALDQTIRYLQSLRSRL